MSPPSPIDIHALRAQSPRMQGHRAAAGATPSLQRQFPAAGLTSSLRPCSSGATSSLRPGSPRTSKPPPETDALSERSEAVPRTSKRQAPETDAFLERERSAASQGLLETHAARLCPELVVPSYKEVVLVLPSWAKPWSSDLRGEVRDKLGVHLLTLNLTKSAVGCIGQSEHAPSSSPVEFISVTGPHQRSLAFCRVELAAGSTPQAQIFTREGRSYARLMMAAGDDTPSSARAFRLEPTAAAGWLLHLRGDFERHAAQATNEAGRVLALVAAGEDLDGAHYRLRLGPQAETCLIILALVAIERLLVHQT